MMRTITDPKSGSIHYTFRKAGCQPITILKYEPIKKAYVEFVRQTVESEARIKKGMTQQELANSVYVTRQTISKWELGKSVPDEASLNLLYQCLEIENKERNILKKFAVSKQSLFLMMIAVVFSPAVIGICYCLFKMGKLEDKKFKIMVQGIGFVLFALYFRTLKDNIAYILIFTACIAYIIYRYYLLSLERKVE